MYKRIETQGKSDLYVFDGNFDEFLMEFGVDPEHINKMKVKKLSCEKRNYYEYSHLDKEQRKILVPLEKVTGTSRGTSGWSVYDNVMKMYQGDREPYRFEDCFSHRKGLTLEEYQKTFETEIRSVDMTYYVEDDEYYVSSDGNHRTLISMLIGAEYILANVSNQHINLEKKTNYELTKEFFNKHHIVKVTTTPYNHKYTIYFKGNDGLNIITGYKPKTETESLEEYFSGLGEKIEHDLGISRIIKRVPLLFQKVFIHFCRNKQVNQILHPIYHEEDKFYYEQKVYFY